MKKIIGVFLIGLLMFTSNAQIPKQLTDNVSKHLKDGSATIYKDAKAFYHTDVKAVVGYGVDKIEQGVDTLYRLLGKGYQIMSKGAEHTFDVVKTQQLVKSLHHLFYWIIALILTIVIFKKLKAINESSKEKDYVILIVLLVVDGLLSWYNGEYFMEMWTGFINPEYGVYMEILKYIQ